MNDVSRLHLVTPAVDPDRRADVDRLLDAVDAVVAAGAPLIQVRTKTGTDRDRVALAALLTRRIQAGGALALINDRVDMALVVGADGVHLGADDLPVADARHLLGPEAIVGATARTPADGRRAVASGATYLGVGPAYATATKIGLPEPMGADGVAAVAAAVPVPVVAIAGVTVACVPELLAVGAHGVAVVGAVFAADDPAAATADFLAALDSRS